MRMVIVSVFDRAIGAYGRPVFVQAVGQAVRSFRDEINNAQGEMFKHPSDYELYEIGAFEDEAGALLAIDRPRVLCRGEDCVEVKRVQES